MIKTEMRLTAISAFKKVANIQEEDRKKNKDRALYNDKKFIEEFKNNKMYKDQQEYAEAIQRVTENHQEAKKKRLEGGSENAWAAKKRKSQEISNSNNDLILRYHIDDPYQTELGSQI